MLACLEELAVEFACDAMLARTPGQLRPRDWI